MIAPILLALSLVLPTPRRPGALPSPRAAVGRAPMLDTAVFAGGCFWGIEAVFDHVRGVISATSGFAGGAVRSPSYEEVSSGNTGHAESVRVVFDPTRIAYPTLLQIFFSVHDPTELNRQGPDVGPQYRSIVFYRNEAQRRSAEAYIAQLAHAHIYSRPIATQLLPLGAFFPAEAYHQHFLERHRDLPYIVINDLPKLDRLRRGFPSLYRE